MPTPPERYRAPETPAEHLRALQAERRGDKAARIETEEYRAYRADALKAAGLDEDDGDRDRQLEEMTPEQHLKEIRRG